MTQIEFSTTGMENGRAVLRERTDILDCPIKSSALSGDELIASRTSSKIHNRVDASPEICKQYILSKFNLEIWSPREM